jgi:Spy/CpxP family protein refolding chaperone
MSKYTMALVVAAALVIAGGIIVAAETGVTAPATPPAKAAGAVHPGGFWAEKLGLTPDQQGQVKAIMTAAHDQAKNATDRAERMKIYKDAFEKVKATVLTDAQRKLLEELRASPTVRAQSRMHFVGAKLGLTPDQRVAAKAILKAAHEEAVKAADKAAKVKIFKDAFDKIRTTVLTDAQRQKLADIREKMKEWRLHQTPAQGAPTTPPAKS